jgi:magnesium-transporting ATPase (P-type)
MRDAVDAAEKIRTWEDHMWDRKTLGEKLDVDLEKGHTDDFARKRLNDEGKNALTEKGKTPKWVLFLKEQTGMFSLLLWVAGILCFFAYII